MGAIRMARPAISAISATPDAGLERVYPIKTINLTPETQTHGHQEERHLPIPVGKLRPAPGRHGCLALQGLHSYSSLRKIRVRSRRSAGCADRGAGRRVVCRHEGPARFKEHWRGDGHDYRPHRGGKRPQRRDRSGLL